MKPVNIILNIIGYSLVLTSIFLFGLKGMPKEMAIAVAGSFVFLAFANLDKFSKFKGAGFEAELRAAVNEANATIDNLKSVAIPLMVTNLNLMARAGRLVGDEIENPELGIFDSLLELQKRMEIENDQLEKAKLQFLNIHAWDIFERLISSIEQNQGHGPTINLRKELGSYDYEKAPDLKKLEATVDVNKFNEKSVILYERLKTYYEKYRL